MERITRERLEEMTAQLAAAMGRPGFVWLQDETGKFRARVGALELTGAYGVYQVAEIVLESGATRTLTRGFQSPREVAQWLDGAMWAWGEHNRQANAKETPEPDDYGMVGDRGETYILRTLPVADNYRAGDVRYYARAERVGDEHNRRYRIAWEPTPEWRLANERAALAYMDEAKACDWDRPVAVELM